MSSDQPDLPPKQKKEKRKSFSKKRTNFRWVIKMIIWTFVISMTFSFLSSQILSAADYILACSILLVFIFIGVLFDILGVAVTSANEKPFHSMAARKVPGAIEALRLIRSAEKVASFCNDVVGDISGIISGTTSAVVVTRLVGDFSLSEVFIQLVVSGLVAALTVGGKAMGKSFAMNFNTEIVHFVGKAVYYLKYLFGNKKAR